MGVLIRFDRGAAPSAKSVSLWRPALDALPAQPRRSRTFREVSELVADLVGLILFGVRRSRTFREVSELVADGCNVLTPASLEAAPSAKSVSLWRLRTPRR